MSKNNLKHTHPISFRKFDIEKDASVLLEWVNNPHAKYWGMLEANLNDLVATYTQLLSVPNYQIYIGEINQESTFLMESYDPKTDFIAKHYDVLAGDCGMHVLIKPPQEQITGFTWHIFSNIINFLFKNKKCKRIVVEPDVNNKKIHRLNKRAGFKYDKQVVLPEKIAFLAFCTLESYEQQCAKLIEI